MSKDLKNFKIQPVDEQALKAWKQRKKEENPTTFFTIQKLNKIKDKIGVICQIRVLLNLSWVNILRQTYKFKIV